MVLLGWQQSHTLAPLIALTNIELEDFKHKWTKVHDKAFAAARAMVAQDTLLCYPDPNIPFVIETDASVYQLGAVLKQDNRPVAFFSRKLTEPQHKYSVIEKELLSILETLEEFHPLIWGARIIVRTDHRNLSFSNSHSQQVLNWRLLVEDFKPKIVYYPEVQNVEADTLSRYPMISVMRLPLRSTALHSTRLSTKQWSTTLKDNLSPLTFFAWRRNNNTMTTQSICLIKIVSIFKSSMGITWSVVKSTTNGVLLSHLLPLNGIIQCSCMAASKAAKTKNRNVK